GPNPFAGAVNPLVEVQKAVGPGATAFLVVQSLGALLFCTLLLVSGIGLIGMRPWARWLAVVYAVYSTFLSLARVVFQVVLINPTTIRAMKQQMPAFGGATNNPFLDPTLLNIMSVMEGLVYLAYAFVILVILFLPGVSAAFAGRPAGRDEDDRE